ncbi:MAG: Holliday junction resolvase RuvX [Dermatophilaceae bacterium]
MTPPPAGAPGVVLGVDVGTVRIGVAACDPDRILATPVTTVSRIAATVPTVADADVEELGRLVEQRSAVRVVVGLPRSMSGEDGPAASYARSYARVLAARVAPVEVRLIDERLTTVDAHRALRESGVLGRRQRSVVDQAAAVLILQTALDAERASGSPPGERVLTSRRKPRTKGAT